MLKVKQCNGRQPTCLRCDRREITCIYPLSHSDRLNRAEGLLKEAHNEIERLSSYITSFTGQKPEDIPDLRPQLGSTIGLSEAVWRQNLAIEVDAEEPNDLIHTHPSIPSLATV